MGEWTESGRANDCCIAWNTRPKNAVGKSIVTSSHPARHSPSSSKLCRRPLPFQASPHGAAAGRPLSPSCLGAVTAPTPAQAAETICTSSGATQCKATDIFTASTTEASGRLFCSRSGTAFIFGALPSGSCGESRCCCPGQGTAGKTEFQGEARREGEQKTSWEPL